MEGSDYLTPDEVADLIKVHPATVRIWVRDGELPALRAGARRVRIRRSDLDAFLAGRGSAPTNEVSVSGLDNAAVADALDAVADALVKLAAALRPPQRKRKASDKAQPRATPRKSSRSRRGSG